MSRPPSRTVPVPLRQTAAAASESTGVITDRRCLADIVSSKAPHDATVFGWVELAPPFTMTSSSSALPPRRQRLIVMPGQPGETRMRNHIFATAMGTLSPYRLSMAIAVMKLRHGPRWPAEALPPTFIKMSRTADCMRAAPKFVFRQ